MCNRFSFIATSEAIETQFGVNVNSELSTSYNISGTQQVQVISSENKNVLDKHIWGLIPYTSNDGRSTNRLINARREGIAASSSFRIPIRKRRCLILADSFYEWKREGIAQKPFRIQLKDKSLMAMAGIWDLWDGGNHFIKSCSIITTSANQEMGEIHNRMPVLIQDKALQQQWLNNEGLDTILNMLQTTTDDSLDIYQISDKINDPTYDQVDIHTPYNTPPAIF